MVTRPDISELEPPYHASFQQVPEGDVLDILAREIDDTTKLLDGIGEGRADHRYAAGKWSIKEVIGHLVDTERIMSYRALSFARGETTDLPGYEQDDYVVSGRFGDRSLESLSNELRAVRAATIALYRGFDGSRSRQRVRVHGTCARLPQLWA
jgi:hypothetical protein